jgi:hypothetical protein
LTVVLWCTGLSGRQCDLLQIKKLVKRKRMKKLDGCSWLSLRCISRQSAIRNEYDSVDYVFMDMAIEHRIIAGASVPARSVFLKKTQACRGKIAPIVF